MECVDLTNALKRFARGSCTPNLGAMNHFRIDRFIRTLYTRAMTYVYRMLCDVLYMLLGCTSVPPIDLFRAFCSTSKPLCCDSQLLINGFACVSDPKIPAKTTNLKKMRVVKRLHFRSFPFCLFLLFTWKQWVERRCIATPNSIVEIRGQTGI